MNAKTAILIVIWLALVGLLAWSATLPNPYLQGINLDPSPFYWAYPAVFAVAGGLSILFLVPWRTGHYLLGAFLNIIIWVLATVFLFLGFIHTPPVHEHLFYVCLLCSQIAVFYGGYSLGRRIIHA